MTFHLRFVAAGGNELNTRAYLGATHYRLPVTAPGRVAADEIALAMAQHGAMVQALAVYDFSRLRQLARDHLEDSRRRLIAKVVTAGGRIQVVNLDRDSDGE